MQNSISQELVDKVAQAAYEKQIGDRYGIADKMLDYKDLSAGTKQTLRENTLEFLNMVVPAMIEDGWTPATGTDNDPELDPDLDNLRAEANEHGMLDIDQAEELFQHVEQLQQQLRNERVTSMAAAVILHDVREAVTDQAVQELQTSLMDHLKLDPIGSGYTSRESISGYSEGAEHGTISLASRIKTILGGTQNG